MSGPVREIECKLDARDAAQLARVRDFILKNPHYVSTTDERFRHELLRGLDLPGPAQEYTEERVRVYYDDASLTGYRNGVEIRVEAKADGWKMTVKIGGNRSVSGAFSRGEYPVKLDSARPDLGRLDKNVQKEILKRFGVDSIEKIKLRPLIEIASQRWRFAYHPDGDPRRIVEYAHDVARGRTFTGFVFPLFQAEIERKKGDRKIVLAERKLLVGKFNFLSIATASKPSAGFDVLMRQLDSKEAQKFVRDRLTPGEFRVYRQPAFTRIP